MVPTRIRVLDRMPLNANGKVDRRALARKALGDAPGRGPREVVAARNDVERVLCEEYGHVLGLEVGIMDDFFDLGGHSLMAAKLVARVNSRLNLQTSVKNLFENPVVSDYATKIQFSLENGELATVRDSAPFELLLDI